MQILSLTTSGAISFLRVLGPLARGLFRGCRSLHSMELRLEAPGARVQRIDPEHAVEDRQAFLQVAILDPKGGEHKEGIDVIRVRQEALPDQRCGVRALNGHGDTPSRRSWLQDAARAGGRPPGTRPRSRSSGPAACDVDGSSPPPMHPSEAARQERLDDRPGLIETCDPTVPIDERWAGGFLRSPLDGLLRREQ